MSKGNTNIQGIYILWREWQDRDALRIIIRPPNGKSTIISSKTYPLLGTINRVIKQKKLKKTVALEDPEVKHFFGRLCQELKQDYILPYYQTLEKLDLKRKGFDFEESLEEFKNYKSMHSIPYAYSREMEIFWLPFFINKKCCEHPKDFIEFQSDAEFYLRAASGQKVKRYAPSSYNKKTTSLNEYMRFLLKKRIISKDQFFTVDFKLTMEERKRRLHAPVRSTETYALDELAEIKTKIDATYNTADQLQWKLRAYGIYLGSYCFGLRVGNVLGMPTANLLPDDEVPHAQLKDNVVAGWSRGLRGDLRIENATKTSYDENVKIPFILPSVEICQNVSRFLKMHIGPQEPILKCSTGVPGRWWRKIAKDCNFRYIHPHGGRHGFATLGAANLHLFNNNPYLLQYCCLHQDFRTTQKYINQKSQNILMQFKR